MIYETSYTAVAVFAFFVAVVLGISFYLGAKAKSASGYYAAHGQIPWFVNGVAFAGDYLSAASFLGICGMIAFYGYDGFLYSIGYLAGWIVALLVIAEPLKRLGKFTFADALDSKFNSRGIKLAAAISTLVVSVFYLIPQMVGAGALVKPLLGFPEHYQGVVVVGVVVVLIVVTAGMVSTTWVQFIKGGLLVVFCTILTAMILNRGLEVKRLSGPPGETRPTPGEVTSVDFIEPTGQWIGRPYVRERTESGRIVTYRQTLVDGQVVSVARCQTLEIRSGKRFVDGLPQGNGPGRADFWPVGAVRSLPGQRDKTGPLGPAGYLATLQQSEVETWSSEKIADDAGTTTVYYPVVKPGADLLTPGGSPTFSALRSNLFVESESRQVFSWKALAAKLDFLSLMIALFGGTASLPHILIRYYTVKDQASARKSTVVGIASIGFFYVLTLFLGLGAMTSGTLDVTDSNMAAPLLARSFGELPFAVISAIAFTTVLGTVSGLIMAASGAVAHDFLANFLKIEMNDATKVRAGKVTAVVVGIIAIVLGILFGRLNVNFLVGWAFNVAASANLPSLIMLLFWRGTTKQGITAAIFVGMLSSLAWILLSAQCYKDVYGLDPAAALVPFSQPGIVTIPLGFAVLVAVSWLTREK
ncbi:MAG: cation acetate symporter [Planctomycetaceae bacterium]|nr:cation acetate symporter [Planctomycetaceae bacterium]